MSQNNLSSSDLVNELDLNKLYSLYEPIDENIYLVNRLKDKKNKQMVCDCVISEHVAACGDGCLNRMLMLECGKVCPCGDFCTNRNFKEKNNAQLQPFITDKKGYGLMAANDIKENSFLIEYVGEIISLKELQHRCVVYANENQQHFYFMSYQNNSYIDSTKKGNLSRFFNHSCDPNCKLQKWTVNGELRIGIFTSRFVRANEELTFDYQFQNFGKIEQTCHCRSTNCRGFLSTNNNLNHLWKEDEETDHMPKKKEKHSKKSRKHKHKSHSNNVNNMSQIFGKNSQTRIEQIEKFANLRAVNEARKVANESDDEISKLIDAKRKEKVNTNYNFQTKQFDTLTKVERSHFDTLSKIERRHLFEQSIKEQEKTTTSTQENALVQAQAQYYAKQELIYDYRTAKWTFNKTSLEDQLKNESIKKKAKYEKNVELYNARYAMNNRFYK